MMNNNYITNKEKTFYFLSVFYSKQDWMRLLPHIYSFFNSNQTIFQDCILSFSLDQGDHIKIIFTSGVKNREIIHEKINHYFLEIIKEHPSAPPARPYPSGERLWMDYPNNTLIWYKFNLPQYIYVSDTQTQFTHYISLLIMLLADPDGGTDDELTSLTAFFIVNLCKSKHFKFSMIEKYQTGQEEEETDENMDAIDSYWNYEFDDSETSDTFSKWIKTVDDILASDESTLFELVKLIGFTLNSEYLLGNILTLMANWYQTKFHER